MENELGALIRSHREANDHTLAHVGKVCGVRDKTVWLWQAGRAKPSARKLPKLARYLGITRERALELFETPAVNRKEVARGA